MKYIWKMIKRTARGLGALGTFVGIVYLWPDLIGLPEEYPFLKGLKMPSRETAIIIFAFLCVAYIFWIDIRPLAKKQRIKPIDVDGFGKSYLVRDVLAELIRATRNKKSEEILNYPNWDMRERLSFFGTVLKFAASREVVKIYGKRPDSPLYEIIKPKEWMDDYWIDEKLNRAKKLSMHENLTDCFEDIAMLEKDYKKLRNIVKSAKEFPIEFEQLTYEELQSKAQLTNRESVKALKQERRAKLPPS